MCDRHDLMTARANAAEAQTHRSAADNFRLKRFSNVPSRVNMTGHLDNNNNNNNNNAATAAVAGGAPLHRHTKVCNMKEECGRDAANARGWRFSCLCVCVPVRALLCCV